MGSLDLFESSEKGKARMEQLRALGAKCQDVVNKMRAVAIEYQAYRVVLDPVADAEDVAYSDASLDYMCDQLKPILDSLSPEEKSWLDAVMNSLGFQPIVE